MKIKSTLSHVQKKTSKDISEIGRARNSGNSGKKKLKAKMVTANDLNSGN